MIGPHTYRDNLLSRVMCAPIAPPVTVIVLHYKCDYFFEFLKKKFYFFLRPFFCPHFSFQKWRRGMTKRIRERVWHTCGMFIPEESGHFRFLHSACLVNINVSVGLILAKASAIRISIPLDLSSRPFIPPPRFLRSRRPTTLLTPSLVFFHTIHTIVWFLQQFTPSFDF